MPYVYRHIRLDKNEPFYIGIGSDNEYKRAYYIQKRNNIWNKIVSNTSYEVEIILDNLTWDDACNKEKEFIKLYGRKNLRTGILSNLTDGGEGVYGLKFTDESKKKMSIAQKSKKPISEETRNRMSIASRSRDMAYNKGKVQSEETRKKRSLSMKQWHLNNSKNK
jgi:hypothetical protein